MKDNEHNIDDDSVISEEQYAEGYIDEDGNIVIYEEVVIDDDSEYQVVEENESVVEDNGVVVEGYSNDDGIVYYKYDDNNTEEVVYEETTSDESEEEISSDSEEIEESEDEVNDNDSDSNVVENNDDSIEEVNNNESNSSIEDVVVFKDNEEPDSIILGDNIDSENVSSDNANESEEEKEFDKGEETSLEKTEEKTSEVKSVFTKEEKESLVTDEANRAISMGGNARGTPIVQLNINSNQNVASNGMYQNNLQQRMPMQQSAVAQQVTQYQMQSAIAQQQVGMTQVPVQNQQYQQVMQYQQPSQYQQSSQAVVQQYPQPMQSQMKPIGAQQSLQQPINGVVAVQGVQQYPNMVNNQNYHSQIPVATSGVVPPNMISGQVQPMQNQMMNQANASMMYQHGSAMYAARGVQPMGQNPYQSTAAQQMGRINTYQNPMMMNRTSSPATKPLNNSSSYDKSIYKKGFSPIKFLFTLIILTVVAFFVYVIFFRKSNYMGSANLNSIFDPNKPIVIYKDDMAGYINTKGEVLIEPMFDSAGEFYGGFAPVLVDETYKIINEKGETVITAQTKEIPTYDMNYDVWIIDNTLYGNEMQKLVANVKNESNGLYSFIDDVSSKVGLVDNLGEVLHSAPGESIEVEVSKAYEHDAYALVRIPNSEDVIISTKAKKVIYNSAANTIKNEHDAIFSVTVNGATKFLYFNEGNLLKEFDGVKDVSMFNYKKGILEISKDGGEYYYDTINGTELDDADYDFSSAADDERYYGFEKMTCGEGLEKKHGLSKGEEVIFECVYDSIKFLDVKVHEFVKRRTLREYVVLVKGTTVELYDLVLKKTVLELDNVEAGSSSDTTYIVFKAKEESNTKEDVVYNLLTGKKTSFPAGEYYYLGGPNYLITIDKNNTAAYYNIKMENIFEIEQFLQ